MTEQYLIYAPEQLKQEVAREDLDLAHRLIIKLLLDRNEYPGRLKAELINA